MADQIRRFPVGICWMICWWKKSCTSWWVVYPIIYKVFLHPRWCRISYSNSMLIFNTASLGTGTCSCQIQFCTRCFFLYVFFSWSHIFSYGCVPCISDHTSVCFSKDVTCRSLTRHESFQPMISKCGWFICFMFAKVCLTPRHVATEKWPCQLRRISGGFVHLFFFANFTLRGYVWVSSTTKRLQSTIPTWPSSLGALHILQGFRKTFQKHPSLRV